MTYLFKLARRGARLRALLVPAVVATFAACNTDQLAPNTNDMPTTVAVPTSLAEASVFRGGIPFGTFDMPTSLFGDRYNGAMQNIWPEFLLNELAQIKARGGKVVLMFAGSEQFYKDGDGHFSFSKWKARVDRFRSVNFSSYVDDGTIIGHYLIDEPHDDFNWNGQPVTPAQIEEMAQYSKGIWPRMTTIVREEPSYMAQWSGSYRYLDVAWAQYAARRGDAADYLRRNIADAQKKGLALIVGMNLLKGGNPNGTAMSASEVQQYGSALLGSNYPCAFLSWQHNDSFLKQTGMGEAMQVLSNKAENRPTVSCGGGTSDEPPPPDEPTTLPSASGISLTAKGWTGSDRVYVGLTWSGARGSYVKLYRNGVLLRKTVNDGKATTVKLSTASATYSFKVCETGTDGICSNVAKVTF